MSLDKAISLAFSLSIPYCNHKVLVPTLTACSAIAGVSAEGLKTLTISILSLISSNFSKTFSPLIFLPTAKGLL